MTWIRTTARSVRRAVGRTPGTYLTAWEERIPVLRAALDASSPDRVHLASVQDLGRALADVVDVRDRAQVWLTLAVLSGRLPDRTTVIETARASEFDDAASLWRAVARMTTHESARWRVRVTDGVLIDVAHTASTVLTTGIQRVARETARRWLRDHDCTPVSWTRDFQSMRELAQVERARIESAAAKEDTQAPENATVLVPWRATYLVPELAAEPARTARLLPLAELTGTRTGAIGFDCVPITSAETTQRGFAGVFARNLAAVRCFDRVAGISGAAATEYSGWRSTLRAIGREGPAVRAVHLPLEAAQPTEEDIEAATARFLVGNLPLVLVVGSHEPRKNHLSVLHAAELLWREGLKFSLSFVGGNSWGSEGFQHRLANLLRQHRPVDSASRLSDGQLWAAYRLARCTVFPSLHEGYGLPVAESLAAGTPAITSNFGSMAEIAAGGGALTVDPHDDHNLADALRALLTDDSLHTQLAEEARRRPTRTWDMYAAELWAYLAEPDD